VPVVKWAADSFSTFVQNYRGVILDKWNIVLNHPEVTSDPVNFIPGKMLNNLTKGI
jgi:hypothetical protein